MKQIKINQGHWQWQRSSFTAIHSKLGNLCKTNTLHVSRTWLTSTFVSSTTLNLVAYGKRFSQAKSLSSFYHFDLTCKYDRQADARTDKHDGTHLALHSAIKSDCRST